MQPWTWGLGINNNNHSGGYDGMLAVSGHIYLVGNLCAGSLLGRALENGICKEVRETGLSRRRG